MRGMKFRKIFAMMLILTTMFTLVACSTANKEDKNSVEAIVGDKATNTNNENKSNDNKGNDNNETEDVAKELTGTVTITGSTSVEKILLDMADEFMAFNPDVEINYIGTGSSAGIEDSILGVNDIGASSRQLKDSELAQGLETVVFAYDGIALITNPKNPVSDLTMDQILKIFSGQITNWSEVGGNDANIIVVSREGASGTRGAFEELTGLEDVGLTDSATVVEGNGNVQATVAGNENAIGYVSFSFINDSVKALTIEGVKANADEVKASKYFLSRPFLFSYKPENLSDLTKEFLEFVVSAEAQQVAVEQHGGIRID